MSDFGIYLRNGASLSSPSPGTVVQDISDGRWKVYTAENGYVPVTVANFATKAALRANVLFQGVANVAGVFYSVDAADTSSPDNGGNILVDASNRRWHQLGSTVADLSASDFGAVSSLQTTTGSMAAASTALTLASALDFANGQGIAVYHAGNGASQVGTSTPLTSPGAPTVTVEGTAGATSHTYVCAATDDKGGVTAAGSGTTITTSNATLGSTNYNALSVGAVTGARAYAWYRDNVLIAITDDPSYNDQGAPFSAVGMQANIVPSAPPGTALGQTLVTTIVSGAGTTSLTLAAASSSATSGSAVHHDNSTAISAMFAAAAAMLPSGSKSTVSCTVPGGTWPITAQVNVPAGCTLDCQGVIYSELSDKYYPCLTFAPGSHVDKLFLWANLLSGVQLGTVSVESDMRIGHIRAWNVGTEANAGGTMQQIGCLFKGYDFEGGSVEVDGGNVGIDINQASDVRISRLISVIASTALRITSGCEQIFLPVCQFDSPYTLALQVDSSDGIRIGGRMFTNNNNNTASLSSGYAAIIGQYSSGSPVTGLDFDFEINNTGGTGVLLDYVDQSHIKVNVNNKPLGTGNSTPVLNGVQYGTGAGANLNVSGEINVTGTTLVGTPVGQVDALINGVRTLRGNAAVSIGSATDGVALRLRQDTLANIQAITPAMGEIVVATDQTPPLVAVGDGTTAGGRPLADALLQNRAYFQDLSAVTTTSLTVVQLGSSIELTPQRSGNLIIDAVVRGSNNTLGDGLTIGLYTGSSSGALTTVLSSQTYTQEGIASDEETFVLHYELSAQPIGTPIYFSLGFNAVTGGTAAAKVIELAAAEDGGRLANLAAALTSPPPIGGTTPNTVAATSLSTSGNASIGGTLSVSGPGTTAENTLTVADPGSSTGAMILLEGNGATTPSKTLRAKGGNLEALNSAQSAVILTLDDSGNLTLPGTATAAPGTSGNEVVNYSQAANAIPPCAASTATGTSMSTTTTSFTAPSNGILMIFAVGISSAGGGFSTTLSASLAGLSIIYNVAGAVDFGKIGASLAMSSGEATTLTYSLSGASSGGLMITIDSIFLPTP